ncbi:PIG-L family deacetylase [Streptomyces sp. H10-C2]|uniref:PIG-L deacetylase family protein n=1 Tax=unclassified Streptomyces TaxID=2593676 RepID=UPI0024BA9A50|nr:MULTISPECIES: PIG-L family deacetylase [unclassified Streptomyces]MDJ0346243.1 PIG-L family deacetylase [Streptomyces sp. PH10-H1]MDJ0371758.1 PIG-L family deacetylase [Streptomyces sp. H10-C2]
MSEPRRLMAVHAHPDDESIWTGGLLAGAAEHGTTSALITCTDGVLANGRSSASPGTRVDELKEAARLLGITELAVLDYRDSGPEGAGTGSLCAAPMGELVDQLAPRIRKFRPDLLVTYDAFGASGHPDHIAVHRATVAAVEASAHPALYPAIEPWTVPELRLVTLPQSALSNLAEAGAIDPWPALPDAQVDLVTDVRPWLDTKWAAVQAHQSEFRRGARIAAMEDPVLRELFLGTEYYVIR